MNKQMLNESQHHDDDDADNDDSNNVRDVYDNTETINKGLYFSHMCIMHKYIVLLNICTHLFYRLKEKPK